MQASGLGRRADTGMRKGGGHSLSVQGDRVAVPVDRGAALDQEALGILEAQAGTGRARARVVAAAASAGASRCLISPVSMA